MDRRILWLCIAVGSTAGGLLPSAWGAGGLGLQALGGSVVGALAGVWAAARIDGSL